MIGSMAAVGLPPLTPSRGRRPSNLALAEEDGIEVPIGAGPSAPLATDAERPAVGHAPAHLRPALQRACRLRAARRGAVRRGLGGGAVARAPRLSWRGDARPAGRIRHGATSSRRRGASSSSSSASSTMSPAWRRRPGRGTSSSRRSSTRRATRCGRASRRSTSSTATRPSLTLAATNGLDRYQIGRAHIPFGEGVTGRVAAVARRRWSSRTCSPDPRFLWVRGIDQRRFIASMLSVPLTLERPDRRRAQRPDGAAARLRRGRRAPTSGRSPTCSPGSSRRSACSRRPRRGSTSSRRSTRPGSSSSPS